MRSPRLDLNPASSKPWRWQLPLLGNETMLLTSIQLVVGVGVETTAALISVGVTPTEMR